MNVEFPASGGTSDAAEPPGTDAKLHAYENDWFNPQPSLVPGSGVARVRRSVSLSASDGMAVPVTGVPTRDGEAGSKCASTNGALRPQRPPTLIWLGCTMAVSGSLDPPEVTSKDRK